MLWGGRRGRGNFVAASNRWSAAMPQPNDLSRSLVALDQNSTIIAVVELSQVDLARFDADRENGPAARSFAADAHDCIMVRIKRSYRIQVCGTKMCHGELPSDPQ